jgi:hypothetical protein
VDEVIEEAGAPEVETATEAEPAGEALPEQLASGISPLAIPASKQWDATDRPEGWIGRVYGLVVHTTGGGLPASAQEKGVYHTVAAVDWYSRSHGCHYVNGWQGSRGGDLLQMANEREQANGVGISNPSEPAKDQRASVEAGRFDADLPEVLVRLWHERWPGHAHSLELLPGTKTANSCYVHVECVPCVYHFRDELVTGEGVEPLREGLRFTEAQHETVALLAVDIARRNGWPLDEEWWRTPRLVGHEDLTPITRCDPNGGWDPGYLRERPYFDWDYVYELIRRIQGGDPDAPSIPEPSPVGSVFTALGDLAEQFLDAMRAGEEILAVTLAYQGGEQDENEITDLVFFGRHPEMDGRRIQPHETELIQEWLTIRDEVVRPAVATLAGGGEG